MKNLLVDKNKITKLKSESTSYASWTLTDRQVCDLELILNGAFSPLKGFMCQDELESVLNRNCLLDGSKWTMPVTLQLENESFKIIQSGSQIALKSNLGIIVALLDVQEVWKADPEKYAQRWFGTTSKKHPGVERLIDGGNTFVAGRVSLIERLESKNRQFELTPAQTRFVFSRKGWSRVVGFHTRNVIHRVHEHIQLEALEKANADGIYISPISGPRKKGDFLPEQILKSYQLMLDQGLYPPGKVMLGSFASYPRYGGPREAVFTALCRKNMGCSHFVIGRDHTGVGDFYHPDANRKIFDELGSLGIEPIFFDAIGYDSQKKVYKSIDNESTITKISGTDARAALVSGKALPDWYMRNIIQDYLREEINSGKAIFSK